jgi:hypothetical protein
VADGKAKAREDIAASERKIASLRRQRDDLLESLTRLRDNVGRITGLPGQQPPGGSGSASVRPAPEPPSAAPKPVATPPPLDSGQPRKQPMVQGKGGDGPTRGQGQGPTGPKRPPRKDGS